MAGRGFLLAFGLLLVVMYLKGPVRVSSGQLDLAIIREIQTARNFWDSIYLAETLEPSVWPFHPRGI